jgi:hypothetical protein
MTAVLQPVMEEHDGSEMPTPATVAAAAVAEGKFAILSSSRQTREATIGTAHILIIKGLLHELKIRWKMGH